MAKIIYTHTDEAPMLATHSFLPMVEAFASQANVPMETRDISLAGRIIATFSHMLPENQRINDALAELGEMTQSPDANIVKLPNISASVPQLKAAVAELQAQGYDLPNLPDEPKTDEEREIRELYGKVMGSAVNPVLREGNSDRRAPQSVKSYAKKNPHTMGEWTNDSKTNVATMGKNDFASNEKSVVLEKDDELTIRFTPKSGEAKVLKPAFKVLEGEVVDGTFMSVKALDAFLKEQVARAKDEGILFSAHLKATMMKVSDPIIFGRVVRAYFADLFEKYGDKLAEAGLSPNNGLAAIISGLDSLDAETAEAVKAEIEKAYNEGPAIAMVDSSRGITNLHVPSDVIVDASMPAMIRTSGQMWNADDKTQDTLAIIPDSSYAGVYQTVIEDCRANGAFDPATMGTVPNVGLMAQKAEEYGSHDKTFQLEEDGTVEVVNSAGDVLISHEVEAGDIWRACQTKDLPIRNWVELAVERSRQSGMPAVFWLDENRAHDANLIEKVNTYLKDLDTDGLDIRILAPKEATQFSVDRIRKGEDTISVTGNVLRDYLTDLFPILELGTSAKMLSIVPLLAGGGLFETGAGGSAPKHVQQLVEENHLRWDSLGEFLALAESFEKFGRQTETPAAEVLGRALDAATGTFLDENKSPSRKVGELDNRGSHYFLVRYWAEELAKQTEDARLAEVFAPVAKALAEKEDQIISELNGAQGVAVDLGGYYRPDEKKVSEIMRPSATLNEIIDGLKA
ncbi:NADP-dependent isocitrate dehydrogenase [Pseudoglutamicibacter cumminsii]|uniref:Isocitrate dehydrogenase [NADP] n=1 Tax=Pseudoglutamicibacter cumminsii TaxID=156979 RepID=A0ABX5L855_9MICC|nr:NADP-dependent isocitrate dehydrogenase [Pseudoglutamicibacter cumminsii]PWI27842.1 NADP-dependent isocitrate dehydrogenase [Pseudoglutamicibacter cumminsii]